MEKVFMLTVDGTSSGYYENSAYSLLFKTYGEAEQYVESEFITNVVNANCGRDMTSDEISAEIENTCKWDNEYSAQYRQKGGESVIDYKIEEVSIPN